MRPSAQSVNSSKYVLLAGSAPGGPFSAITSTNTAGGTTITFNDPSPGAGPRFYKVQFIP
jgi:hypothetical protein